MNHFMTMKFLHNCCNTKDDFRSSSRIQCCFINSFVKILEIRDSFGINSVTKQAYNFAFDGNRGSLGDHELNIRLSLLVKGYR